MNPPAFTPRMLGEAENALRALMNRFLAGTGLTYHTWVLLTATAASGGSVDRGQLTTLMVNGLKIDTASADRAIATVAQAGLITATADAVTLTEAGATLYQRLRTAMEPATTRIMQGHSADDLAATARVLTAITHRANEILAAEAGSR